GLGASWRIHVERQVRARGGVVPESEGATRVEQLGGPRNRPEVAGDVRRRGEAADLERALRVVHERGLEGTEIELTARVLRDGHDRGDGLAPGELVAVMLVRADEDDRPLPGRDPLGEAVASVEVAR